MDNDLFSPQLLKDISADEIESYIQSDSAPNWCIKFKTFPVHTQTVERCETRRGMVLSEQLSCQGQPCLTSYINQISEYLQLRMSKRRFNCLKWTYDSSHKNIFFVFLIKKIN